MQITKEHLLRYLRYAKGKLYWKVRPPEYFATKAAGQTWNTRFANTEAGTPHPDGYTRVKVDGRFYLAHGLIWVMHHGDIPPGVQIDHINHRRDDNRIENLRLVSQAENRKNSGLSRNNRSGAPGVYRDARYNRWYAYIGVDGKRKYLGTFLNQQDAVAARNNANAAHGYHKNHGVKNAH